MCTVNRKTVASCGIICCSKVTSLSNIFPDGLNVQPKSAFIDPCTFKEFVFRGGPLCSGEEEAPRAGTPKTHPEVARQMTSSLPRGSCILHYFPNAKANVVCLGGLSPGPFFANWFSYFLLSHTSYLLAGVVFFSYFRCCFSVREVYCVTFVCRLSLSVLFPFFFVFFIFFSLEILHR